MRYFSMIAVVGLIVPFASLCEDVAVVSETAKYMLLDGETLATRDVGDLRWMGVWGVDAVIPGSTSAGFAFVTDSLSTELASPDDSGSFQQSALVVVTDLAEGGGASSKIAISHDYKFSMGDAMWIDGSAQLIVWERTKSRIAVLDEGLNEVDGFASSLWNTGATLACRRDGKLFVATGSRRTTRWEGESTVDGLAKPGRFEDCRVENTQFRGNGVASPSTECRGTLGCRNDARYARTVVDIADNRVVAWYESPGSANRPEDRAGSGERAYLRSALLFADGARLLRQQETWTPLPDGPSVYRSTPGPLLRTVDTHTGQVARENSRAPTGYVSRVFCRGTAERTVMSGDGSVHLIDLNTLEPVASSQIPFDRPFVF